MPLRPLPENDGRGCLGDEPNSEVVSKSEGRAEREKLSMNNEASRASWEDSRRSGSDGLQEGPGLSPEPQMARVSRPRASALRPLGRSPAIWRSALGDRKLASWRGGLSTCQEESCKEKAAVQAGGRGKREEITPAELSVPGPETLASGDGLLGPWQWAGVQRPAWAEPGCRTQLADRLQGPRPEGSAVRGCFN